MRKLEYYLYKLSFHSIIVSQKLMRVVLLKKKLAVRL